MQLLRSCALLGSLALTACAGGEDVFNKAAAVKQRYIEKHGGVQHPAISKRSKPYHPHKRQSTSPYLNPNSQKFVVDGTAIPEVNFDIGESYAGLLPISKASNETRQLYFWFFPSKDPDAGEEIAIWVSCYADFCGSFVLRYNLTKIIPSLMVALGAVP